MFTRDEPITFKRQVRQSFDATDLSYGTAGDFHWNFAQRLVERAPVQRGQHILDIATGSAPAAILAAQRVQENGRVFGIDLSPGIVKLAQQHITAAGLTTVQVVVGDAEALPIASSQVNGILCSSAIVWFPDIPQALREWYRVLWPNGWIAFSCFGGPARQTINELLLELLAPYGISYPELNTPLNSPAKCRALVEAAGFTEITVHTAQHQRFTTKLNASFTQAWTSGSRFSITLPAADVDVIKAQYQARFQQLLAHQDVWNQDYEQFVVARKPGDE